jgi:cytoskeletal protein RodZ
MAVVDLRHELTRPLALILSVLAALGWVLFGLSSWSAASVQKAQRLQIMEVTEKSDRIGAELAKQQATTASIADLEKKVLATREELSRMSAVKADVATELTTAQKKLTAVRRDVTEADRNLAIQSQKLSELQTSATDAAIGEGEAAAAAASSVGRLGRGAKRGGARWSRRGRAYRSYSIMSRTR